MAPLLGAWRRRPPTCPHFHPPGSPKGPVRNSFDLPTSNAAAAGLIVKAPWRLLPMIGPGFMWPAESGEEASTSARRPRATHSTRGPGSMSLAGSPGDTAGYNAKFDRTPVTNFTLRAPSRRRPAMRAELVRCTSMTGNLRPAHEFPVWAQQRSFRPLRSAHLGTRARRSQERMMVRHAVQRPDPKISAGGPSPGRAEIPAAALSAPCGCRSGP